MEPQNERKLKPRNLDIARIICDWIQKDGKIGNAIENETKTLNEGRYQ